MDKLTVNVPLTASHDNPLCIANEPFNSEQMSTTLVCNGTSDSGPHEALPDKSESKSVSSSSDSSELTEGDKRARTVVKPVVLREEPFEWQRTHIGPRLIADHWPHEYQKTLKLFLEVDSS